MEFVYFYLYCAFVMMIIGVLQLRRFMRTGTLTRSTFTMPLGTFFMASGMVMVSLVGILMGVIVLVVGGVLFLVGAIPYSYHQYLTYKRLIEQWKNKNSTD